MSQWDKSTQFSRSQEANLTNFRILIVDDFQFMADLLAGILREVGVGYTISCYSAADAQKIIKEAAENYTSSTHIDMALIDWLMPDTNGVELIKWIRSQDQDHIKYMPIIMLSAYTSKDVVEAARDSGATEALVKPISAEKLLSRIIHVINNDRPFVKNQTYFGPDRRRKEEPFQGEEKRQMDPKMVEVNQEDV